MDVYSVELKAVAGARQFVERLPLFAAILLGAANILQLVSQAEALIAAQRGADTSAVLPSPREELQLAALKRGKPSVTVKTLIAAHLFGEIPATGVAPETERPTAQPLVLAGTIAMDNPRSGLGIFGPTGQPAKVYAVGDLIGTATRLQSVYADHITLDSGGHLETLRFPRAPPILSGAARNTPEAGEPTDPDGQPAPSKADKVLARLSAYPTWDGKGQFTGYEFNPSPKERRQSGVLPGDRLVAVNGTEIASEASVQQAFEQVTEQVTLIVRRGDQDVALPLHKDGG